MNWESNGSSPETLKQAKDGTSLAVVQHLGSYLPVQGTQV